VADASILDFGPIVEGLARDLGLTHEALATALDVDRRSHPGGGARAGTIDRVRADLDGLAAGVHV
jgi:hypothetical protein